MSVKALAKGIMGARRLGVYRTFVLWMGVLGCDEIRLCGFTVQGIVFFVSTPYCYSCVDSYQCQLLSLLCRNQKTSMTRSQNRLYVIWLSVSCRMQKCQHRRSNVKIILR